MPSHVAKGGPRGKGVARPGAVGGKTVLGGKRHRKLRRDTITSITKGDIRRLARRGGVKRISGQIYDEIRGCLKDRLTLILHDCVAFVEHRNGKTVSVNDVIWSLRRIGRPIYGFDPETYTAQNKPGKRKLSGD